jgi:hypothetical protein
MRSKGIPSWLRARKFDRGRFRFCYVFFLPNNFKQCIISVRYMAFVLFHWRLQWPMILRLVWDDWVRGFQFSQDYRLVNSLILFGVGYCFVEAWMWSGDPFKSVPGPLFLCWSRVVELKSGGPHPVGPSCEMAGGYRGDAIRIWHRSRISRVRTADEPNPSHRNSSTVSACSFPCSQTFGGP